MNADGDQPRPVTTTQTAVSIIELLKRTGGASISNVANQLDIARSTAHRHLRTLGDEGWVARNEDEGTYEVSLNVFHIGATARKENLVYQFAKDRVNELADRTGERAWCIVEEGGRGIHLYGASNSPVNTYARVGARTYLHQHAAGKSILAFRPREEVTAIIDEHGLEAITDQTITDDEVLYEELEQVSEQGYAFNREESFRGLHAVGVPICDHNDYALGAISVSGPAHRLKGDLLASELPETLLEVANEIEINISNAATDDQHVDD